MGSYERRIWEPNPAAYPPVRALRMGFAYEAFIPDRIAGRSWTLPGDVMDEIVRAEVAISRLNVFSRDPSR